MSTLPYQPPAALLPEGYETTFEAERGRWLRGRFMWYCGLSIALSLVFTVPAGILMLAAEPEDRPSAAFLVTFAAMGVVSLGLYAAAFSFARRSEPSYRTVVRTAVILFIASGVLGVLGNLALLSLDAGLWSAQFRAGVDESLIEDGVPLDSPQAVRRRQVAGYLATASSVLLSIVILHLMTCMIVPWSVRDAAPPTAVVFSAFAAVVLVDAARGSPLPLALTLLGIGAVVLLPGLGICWLRYARFTAKLRTRLALDQYRQIQQELFSARRLHESVLPRQKPDGAIRLHYAYEPMRHIGGDLLFTHALPTPDANGEILHVVVLDATGHGISAALTVNRLVGELQRLYAGRDPSPGKVLAALNEYVYLTLAPHGVFATALVCRFEVTGEAGRVRWAGGGHPPALICSAGGADNSERWTCRHLESQATILGYLAPDEYPAEESELPVQVGEAVVAYTDGVNEAADPSGEHLQIAGVARLARDLVAGGAGSLAEKLLAAVANHRRRPASDDTLVVVIAPSRAVGGTLSSTSRSTLGTSSGTVSRPATLSAAVHKLSK